MSDRASGESVPPRRNVRRARTSGPELGAHGTVESSGRSSTPDAPRARTNANRRSATNEAPPPPRRGRLRSALAGFSERVAAIRWPSRDRLVGAARGAMRLALVVAVLVGMGAAGRLLERYVRTSPAFAIREVRVEGLARLDREEILRIGGIAIGRNVFEMPPEDVRARLERHPWIADASVRRRLPGTLELEVRERRAAAILVVDRTYLVGEDATVFKSLEPGDPSDLPIVTLEDHERWLGDRAAFSALLLDVVSMLDEWRRVGLESRSVIAEVHVESDDGIALYVGEDATRIRLGRGPFETKLRRLRSLFDEMRRRDARPAYVLLDHERRPERVVVRLRETVVPLPPLEGPDAEAPRAPTVVPPTRARTRRG